MKDRRALVFVTPADVADAPDVADVADRQAAPLRGSRAESFPASTALPLLLFRLFRLSFLSVSKPLGGKTLNPDTDRQGARARGRLCAQQGDRSERIE